MLKRGEYIEGKCDRGLYKAKVDKRGYPNIYLSEKNEYIEKETRNWHDHYYKKSDKWYIQVTVSKAHPLAKNDRGHIYEPNTEVEKDLQPELDRMWEQMTKNISWEN